MQEISGIFEENEASSWDNDMPTPTTFNALQSFSPSIHECIFYTNCVLLSGDCLACIEQNLKKNLNAPKNCL